MIGKGWVLLLTAGLLAACEPSAPARPKAPEAAPSYRTAVVSTGAPILNEEYGVSAVFPVGARVCEALSGEHPQGLYTRLGDDRMACIPSADPPKVSSIRVLASSNAAFYRTMEQVIGPDCPAPAPGEPLGFPGLDTTVCEKRLPDGDIEISLHAFAGEWE